jgi:signal transduction histidine kinase
MPTPLPPPERSLRILHVEDAELDHQLLCVQLERSGLKAEVLRVDTLAQIETAIQQPEPWDAVIADFDLPGLSGLTVLKRLREMKRFIPFLLVSGQIGEDMAVEAVRGGASDYLFKGNLTRLAPALLRAIEAAEARNARFESDQALRQSKQRLHELAGHLQTSIEMERAAIAREIHDDVGGSLTAVKFDLAWIARHAQEDIVRQRTRAALDTVTSALEASQRIMHNLRPAILDQGLVAAVQWMASGFERRTGIQCSVQASEEQMQLPPGVPLVAYRAAQEALTNVSKHAQASRVDIELSMQAGVLTLEVNDNGRGIAAEDLAKARSFGIRGLHERAATVGGWVDLSSNSKGNGGTSVILSVPLEDDVIDGGSAWGDA